MTDPRRLRLIGILILAAFPLYGGGQALLANGQSLAGAALIVANSVAVALIGFLFKPVMQKEAPRSAILYLQGRLFEGALLIAGLSAFLRAPDIETGLAENTDFYRLAMIALGFGSLWLCRWLITARRIYSWLAWLGVIGYLCLIASMLADYAGHGNVGGWLLAPGAIFELLLGLLLIFQGLKPASA